MTVNLSLKQTAYAVLYAAILPLTLYFEQSNTSYLLILAILMTLPFVPIALLVGSYISVKLFGTMEYVYYVQYVLILLQIILVLNFYNIKKEEAKRYFKNRGFKNHI